MLELRGVSELELGAAPFYSRSPVHGGHGAGAMQGTAGHVCVVEASTGVRRRWSFGRGRQGREACVRAAHGRPRRAARSGAGRGTRAGAPGSHGCVQRQQRGVVEW